METVDLSKLDTTGLLNMQLMFSSCKNLKTVDLSEFDTSSVNNMANVFNDCTRLESVNMSSFDTSSVTTMAGMFNNGPSLRSLDVSKFNTANVTAINSMFSKCSSLKELNVSNFNTTNVTTIANMFNHCENLETLDLRSFNTANLTTMYRAFGSCYKLENILISEKCDTDRVTDMSWMFTDCFALESLDMSGFNTSSLKNMSNMFNGCVNLKSINGLDKLNTNNVENVSSIFLNCPNLNVLDLSNFQLGLVDKSLPNRFDRLFDCDDFIDDPIPTIIITADEKLIESYNDPDSIIGRTPFTAKVVYNNNGGTFADKSVNKEAVLKETDHFIYSTMEEAKQEFTLTGTTVLTNDPSTSLSKEGSVFNGWYLDEACKKPFDEAATIDFTTLANGTLHLYAGYSEPLQAVELIAYEGGSGTDASNHGDALPEPQWEEGLESYAISVDGEAWDLEEEGVPFAWEYRNSEGEKVESAAKAGSYALYALPRVDDKEIRLDEHLLSLPEEGMAVGEVKVREVSDESAETLSSEIYKGVYEEEGACQIKEAHAHVKAGTQFYKNGNTMYPVNEDAKIVLLWDELIEEVLGSAERMEALHAKGMEAVKGMDETKEVKREFRYLDLVDQNDGNLWVGTEKETVSVYYPYPEGSEAGDRFAVVYYEGLTRDYTMQMSEEALDEAIAKSKGREIEVRKTEGGLEFEVGSKEFGTFEVMWQKEEKPTEPEEKPSEPEEKPTEPEEKPNTPNEEEKGESNIEEIKKEESEAVNTGDEVSKGMYYVLLGGSMIVFAAMLRKNRRSEQ